MLVDEGENYVLAQEDVAGYISTVAEMEGRKEHSTMGGVVEIEQGEGRERAREAVTGEKTNKAQRRRGHSSLERMMLVFYGTSKLVNKHVPGPRPLA